MSTTIIGTTKIRVLRLEKSPDGITTLSSTTSWSIYPCLLDGILPGYVVINHKTAIRRHIPASDVLWSEYDEPGYEVASIGPAGFVAEPQAPVSAEPDGLSVKPALDAEKQAEELPPPVKKRPAKQLVDEPPPEDGDDPIPPDMAELVEQASGRKKRGG